MKIPLNLLNVKMPEALVEGLYRVRVVKLLAKPAKLPNDPNSHPFLQLHLEVVEGEYTGRYLFINLSYSPEALWRTKQVVEALGVAYTEEGFESDDLLGREMFCAAKPSATRKGQNDVSDVGPVQ